MTDDAKGREFSQEGRIKRLECLTDDARGVSGREEAG